MTQQLFLIPPCGILFLCCAVPRCTERGPLNHFEICADSNHEKIQRSTCCAARCSAAEDMDSTLRPGKRADTSHLDHGCYKIGPKLNLVCAVALDL
jgi:hypothetical protein